LIVLTGIFAGVLVLLILITLVIPLFTCWYSPTEALAFGKRIIVIVSWLWCACAPFTLLLATRLSTLYMRNRQSSPSA
jgi:hypothetical protein